MFSINPAYEVIVCAPNESFRWNVHDYPHHLAKWHYHPEFELHLIQASSGRMMIGDYIGDYEPGCLVLTGPNLPHNWVGNVRHHERIPNRDMLVQFTPEFASNLFDRFAELSDARAMLEKSAFGLEFKGAAARDGAAILRQIGEAQGMRRLILFIELFASLSRTPGEWRMLSNTAPALGLITATTETLQRAIDYIYKKYTKDIRLEKVASLCEMEQSTFSRFFKKQTGHNFVKFINQLRIHHACSLLTTSEKSITEICFDSGFNNTANFNRQFAACCRQTPSEYRADARRIAKKIT